MTIALLLCNLGRDFFASNDVSGYAEWTGALRELSRVHSLAAAHFESLTQRCKTNLCRRLTGLRESDSVCVFQKARLRAQQWRPLRESSFWHDPLSTR